MTTENTALTVQQRAVIALGSSKAETELRELAAKSQSITAITNKDGRQECHAAAMVAKDARIAIEKAGKAAREDATAFSKAVIAEEKRLVDMIKPEEDRLISLRDKYDAEEKKKKEAAESAERARIAAIKEKIEVIRRSPMNPSMLDAKGAQSVLDMTEEIEIDDSFADFRSEALEAKAEAIDKLRAIFSAKVSAEATAARIKAEQEAEAARLEQERQRLAAEQRQLDEERARMEAERAEIERQRQEPAKALREANEKAAAEIRRLDAERQAAEQLAANNQTQFEVVAVDAHTTGTGIAQIAADESGSVTVKHIAPEQVVDHGPTIKLGEICTRLGFNVTADFLASLGVSPVATEKNAKLYPSAKFPTICRLISDHVLALAFKKAA